jgi:hypothetical protein
LASDRAGDVTGADFVSDDSCSARALRPLLCVERIGRQRQGGIGMEPGALPLAVVGIVGLMAYLYLVPVTRVGMSRFPTDLEGLGHTKVTIPAATPKIPAMTNSQRHSRIRLATASWGMPPNSSRCCGGTRSWVTTRTSRLPVSWTASPRRCSRT